MVYGIHTSLTAFIYCSIVNEKLFVFETKKDYEKVNMSQ